MINNIIIVFLCGKPMNITLSIRPFNKTFLSLQKRVPGFVKAQFILGLLFKLSYTCTLTIKTKPKKNFFQINATFVVLH